MKVKLSYILGRLSLDLHFPESACRKRTKRKIQGQADASFGAGTPGRDQPLLAGAST